MINPRDVALQAAAGGMVLGEPITELAVLNTFTLLLWQLQSLQQQSGPPASSSAADSAEALGQKVLQFCAHMDDIYEASEGLQRIRDCIFRIQADLFLLFSSDKLEVQCLVYHNVEYHVNDYPKPAIGTSPVQGDLPKLHTCVVASVTALLDWATASVAQY